MIAALFLFMGIAAGAGQAVLLRSAARSRIHPLGFLLRFVIAAGVLVAAALSGQIVVAAAGWAGGFALTVLVLARRWT